MLRFKDLERPVVKGTYYGIYYANSDKLCKGIYQRRYTPLPDICGLRHKDQDQNLSFEH